VNVATPKQLRFDFRPGRSVPAEPVPLVVLSDADLAYRDSAIDRGIEFTESFLVETRAQRRGVSVRDLQSMFTYELNRELAEEASIMALPGWAYVRPAWIDWEMINRRAQHEAEALADDFAAFRKQRMESMTVTKTRRRR